MLFFPMDFGELTIEGLIVTGALRSALSKADLPKIRVLARQTISNERPSLDLHIIVADGVSEKSSARVYLQFEVGDILFKECLIVMTNRAIPIFGLLFLQRNRTVLDIRQRILNLPFFPCNATMQTTRTSKLTNVL